MKGTPEIYADLGPQEGVSKIERTSERNSGQLYHSVSWKVKYNACAVRLV
jgi:hypothetical protein